MITDTIIRGALSLAMAALPTVTSTFPSIAANPPLRQIVSAVQAAPASVTAPEPAPLPVREEAVRSMRVTVTAYSSTPDQCDDTPFITANGTYVHDGIIAANFLPFHTRVRLPELYGDKVFTVEDRMNARFPNRADIWMETRDAARDFGLKRQVLIEVLPGLDEDVKQLAEAK